MKGTLTLSLAIALALSGADAFALGLGAIQVKSGLNQPLDAEIPVLSESADEINGLKVDMASADDFQRVGLNRTRVTTPLDFAVGTNARGQTVIKLTSKEIVREPFLDFLIEVNWAKGKLLREFTVLLDPPLTAPAKAMNANVAPAAESTPAQAHPLAESPTTMARPQTSIAKPPRTTTLPKATPVPMPAAAPIQALASHSANAGEYGPVAQGETLSQIANATRLPDTTGVNRMMLALFKANPEAFYKNNINALKRGAILRIPSADEVKAAGSLSEAAAAVRSQNEAWSSNAISRPTLVAHTGASTKKASAASANAEKVASNTSGQEHLTLVPPRAGKGGENSAEHTGTSSESSKDSAESNADLARTKEALTSREQEAGELKSRLKQLEDINEKDQRLLALKSSEIADLQTKLKQLEMAAKSAPATAAVGTPTAATSKTADASAVASTKPVPTTVSTKAEPKISSQDIWDDPNNNKSMPTAAKPAVTATNPPSATTTVNPSPAISTSTTSTTPPPTTSTTPATDVANTSKDAVSPAAAPTASTTLNPTTAATDTTTLPKPAISSTTPAKVPVPARITPIETSAQPWYQNQTVMLGGGAALLIVGLLVLMRFMRKPKPVFAPAESELGDESHYEQYTQAASEDEQRLLDELAINPADTAASLELLRLYHAQGDAAKFEVAAEHMHTHIADPTLPEWEEALALGADLSPDYPLFSDEAAVHVEHIQHIQAGHEESPIFGHPDDGHRHEAGFELDDFDAQATHPSATLPEENFDFDLPAHHEAATPTAVRDDLSFDFPVITPAAPASERAEAISAAPTSQKGSDFFLGEDAISTKLDLAKAYLDMGDPDGARSMLDEVLTEGNDSQKSEAHRLLTEIK